MQPPNSSSAPSPTAPPPAARPICLRADLADLTTLCEYIEAFGAGNGLTPSDIMAFTLAAEELFANTIRHSHPAATGVEFTLSLTHGLATAVYSDDGGSFDPTAAPQADTTLPQDRRAIGGLGIHFIRRTMQTFIWRRDAGRNLVTFSRVIGRAALS